MGNTFSVLVGRRKWIKMREDVHAYGHGARLMSMRYDCFAQVVDKS